MVNKQLQMILRFLGTVLLSLMLSSNIAHADDTVDLAQIASIQTIGDTDNTEALKRLLELKQKQTASTPIQVRLETLKLLVDLYYDGGKIQSSTAAIKELLSLATSEKDVTGIRIAQIMSVYQLIDNGQLQDGLHKLNAINEGLTADAPVEVRLRLDSAFGTVHYLLGNFDSSLGYLLEALKLSDDMPVRKVQHRIRRLDAIAKLYIAMKDPEKTLSTVEEALDISPLARAPKILASLSISQGIAYSMLNQDQKSIDAYKRALKISRDAGMPTNEVICLINISDHYLTLNEYKKAEIYARQSLQRAEELGDKPSIAIARVNLGFSLAGQGKMTLKTYIFKKYLNFFINNNSFYNTSNLKNIKSSKNI